MVQTATGCMPYNLVFSSEVVLLLEVQLPSLKVIMQFTNPDENTQVRLTKLEALDDCRLMIQQRLEIYQTQMVGAFNMQVKFHSLA